MGRIIRTTKLRRRQGRGRGRGQQQQSIPVLVPSPLYHVHFLLLLVTVIAITMAINVATTCNLAVVSSFSVQRQYQYFHSRDQMSTFHRPQCTSSITSTSFTSRRSRSSRSSMTSHRDSLNRKVLLHSAVNAADANTNTNTNASNGLTVLASTNNDGSCSSSLSSLSSHPNLASNKAANPNGKNPNNNDTNHYSQHDGSSISNINSNGNIAMPTTTATATVYAAATVSATTTTSAASDVITIARHIILCFVLSIVVSFYEGYDCSYLKPLPATIRQFPPSSSSLSFSSSTTTSVVQDIIGLMNSGTRGMGRGEIDRMDGWFQETYFGFSPSAPISTSTSTSTTTSTLESDTNTDIIIQETMGTSSATNIKSLRDIQSYNEIMKNHRENRVRQWRDDDQLIHNTNSNSNNSNNNYSSANNNNNNNKRMSTSTSTSTSVNMSTSTSSTTTGTSSADATTAIYKIQNAIATIYRAIDTVRLLKDASLDYDWDTMNDLLRSDLLRVELGQSCNLLRSSVGYIDYDARQEIGFDWGSCAWRHCGAQADAQEALAELYNSIGLFEPFECLFTIDIVERSLRDILSAVPTKYHSDDDVKYLSPYVPYKSQQELFELEHSGDDDGQYDDGLDSSDYDYLKALAGLKNYYTVE